MSVIDGIQFEGRCSVIYDLATRPIWMCGLCGNIETIPEVSSYMPSAYCHHGNVIVEKQMNAAAAAVVAASNEWHQRKADDRHRAEEELRNWPPIADRYDMRIRAS